LDFQLNEEQLHLKKSVREFAEREIKPNVMKWDEAGEFPLATIKELGKLGLLGMIFPPEYGGAGMGYVEYVTAIEELSRVDGSVGIIVAAHTSLCSNHIFLAGNEAQKKKYVSKLATGEFIGAWGLTEPSSGSDAGSARMTAVRKGNHWVLNGTKTFCTNGHYADVIVVLAVTDRAAHTHGISAFVIEKDTKGFRPGKKENKLGLRASDTAELIFEDCVIPAENLLGGEGQGFPDAMRVLDGGRISIAALSLGMAEGAYEAEIFQAAQTVRQGHQRFPGNPVEAGRHGHRDRRRYAAHHARRVHERRGYEDHAGIFNGEALRQRSGRPVRQRGRADSWRLRLHQGLSRRKILPRREAVHHRRRHQRNPAISDRQTAAKGLS
jgi:alkylation response protein AidB-like acyl-CoA dehydrogenase